MGRGAWQATVHQVLRVGRDLVTKQQTLKRKWKMEKEGGLCSIITLLQGHSLAVQRYSLAHCGEGGLCSAPSPVP